MKHLFIILNLLFYNLFILAQNRIIDSHNHGWYMYFGNYNFSSNFSIHTEYQWRRNDFIKNWQQSLARIGLTYKVYENVSFTTGYGHILTFPYGKQPVDKTFLEHRLWEQILLSSNLAKSIIKHRYRLEQRWLDFQKDWKYQNRFRYQINIDFPLYTITEKNNFLLTFYDEVFLNFGKNIAKNIFDQNRLYGALGLGLNSNTVFRIGYLNQIILKSDGFHEENNHTLAFSLHHNLELKK